MDAIKAAKARFDLGSYVELNYETKVTYGKNGKELRICCPACGDTKHKCYVNPDKGAFFCFKCEFRIGGKHPDTDRYYDVIDVIAYTENIGRPQALLRLLAESSRVTPEELSFDDNTTLPSSSSTTVLREVSLPQGATKLPPTDNPYWEYLHQRGFTPEDLQSTNAHYTPSADVPLYDSEGRYRGNAGHRIIFPVYAGNARMVGWLARTITNKEPKYLNSPDSDMAQALWPNALPKTHHAVLVEGLIDALSVRRVSNVSAYATFGKKVSTAQIQKLKDWGVTEVTLWLDPNAKQETLSVVSRLEMYFTKVSVPYLADWDKTKDTGNFLNDPNGPVIIGNALQKRVSTDNTLEYARWQTTF